MTLLSVRLDVAIKLNEEEKDFVGHLLAGRLFLMQYIKTPITRSRSPTEPAASDRVNTNRSASETKKKSIEQGN